MTRISKLCALVAVGVGASALMASSVGHAAPDGKAASQAVTLTWWHNATADPGKTFWQKVANDYHAANPNVTITPVPLQNEDFKTKIPLALRSDSPPDIFQQWGGGALTDQVKAGKVLNINSAVAPWIKSLGGAAAGWQVGGKQYGVPYSLGIVGLWYNKALFAKAGIKKPPATWGGFLVAVRKLKAAGVAPIAIGAKDKWPDAFWWDHLAVRTCSKKTMQQSAITYNFSDSCWIKAGTLTKQLIDAKPFQNGFLGTPAQQGAGSSAGLLANGKAAMELQGHWNPGVMNSLTPNKKGLGKNLGWFPFPAVPSGKGVPGAALGGGDGFSCSWKAPPECVGFLKYVVSLGVQRQFGKLNIGLPVAKGSESSVSDPNLKTLLKFRAASPFTQLYLDQAYSTAIGLALNDAIANQFAGKSTPQQVVQAIVKAAKKH